ncbi:MAG: Serine hydroxymethyltransferase [Candidatus Gottesmanbacteria bacterium GW2011_GWC2_39_8]|uniref:Serine hydroxymethyltransferase n=1 Tax=Candidatus Gottesmanbacteria bacterium GW2011_GWC2_39_8 TaxID=1618450 RepID=A0A0G0PV37_9BACT|nr:MAG: Serine hydroxymethyltransferase [Candidatus Gottesmanbacteria bacterium GW2011_GWC2_39_8]
MSKYIRKTDKEIADLIALEEKRQVEGLELIPSENYVSHAVRDAVGSVLENKYAEGYPHKRYYTGNIAVDDIETICRNRAKKLFGVPYVNVQPYSGSPANLEIFGAICQPGDLVLSQLLSHGGHLSMGQTASFTSKYYRSEFYHMTKDGEIDFEELEKLAKKIKPKIIWSGGTAYTKVFKWEKYAEIADRVGAYFVADISHIAGLVAGGAHPSPVPFAHLVMTTTHKTLRGPRGAMIMITKKGLEKDPTLPKKVDFSVFPGHQGGPHMNKIAGIAVCLKEALNPSFKSYAKQIVKNSQKLASELIKFDFKLVGGGSENHMVWIDLRNKNLEGWHAHVTLEEAHIYGNKQTIPFDTKSPFYPSGYRIGTPAITTRGMKEKEMVIIAGFINEGIEIAQELNMPDIGSTDHDKDQKARKRFKDLLKKDKELAKLRNRVIKFSKKFKVP